MIPPPDHPPIRPPRIGVLVVNLGTPDAPDVASVKRYLLQFLSDRRVVEIPPLLWQPILRGIVLNTRPKKSAHAYSQVWRADGSPLASITAAQARALQARVGDGIVVRHAMRYGRPDIAPEVAALKDAGCERILFAPLYPQYSGATTGSAIDALADAVKAMRWAPALRTLPPYHDHPAHIEALHGDLAGQLDALDFVPEVLLLSFHGMPERTLQLGDPYHCQCRKTARLLGEKFAVSHPEMRLETTFQSRFGRAKWLEPATDTVIGEEAARGVKRMAIAAPGFSADCLETLEELAIRGAEQFTEAGGEKFAALACLNDGQAGMAMLETLVRNELGGWL